MKFYTVLNSATGKAKVGPGGWVSAVYLGDKRLQLKKGGATQTTYMRMELTGLIEALKFFTEPSYITIITNNQFLINAIQYRMYANWVKRGWKTKAGKEIENRDLWEELIALLTQHQVFVAKGFFKTEEAKKAAKEAIEMAS